MLFQVAEGEVEDEGDGEGADLLNVGFLAVFENCAQIRWKKYCQKCEKIVKILQIFIFWKIDGFKFAQIRKICCTTSDMCTRVFKIFKLCVGEVEGKYESDKKLYKCSRLYSTLQERRAQSVDIECSGISAIIHTL